MVPLLLLSKKEKLPCRVKCGKNAAAQNLSYRHLSLFRYLRMWWVRIFSLL